MKPCSTCKEIKDDAQFRYNKCVSCHNEYRRKHYQPDPNKRTEYHAKYRRDNKEKIEKYRKENLERARRHRLRQYSGMTLELYEELLEAQEGTCALCPAKYRHPNNVHKLCVDHNHETGAVRGLLCSACNSGLGYFKDDTELLLKAITYLKTRS